MGWTSRRALPAARASSSKPTGRAASCHAARTVTDVAKSAKRVGSSARDGGAPNVRGRFALLQLLGALSVAPSAAAPQAGDTVDASAHVFAIIHAWHPDSGRAYCITSMHSWPNYMYIRHVQRIYELEPSACETPELPLFLQLNACPDTISVDGLAPWVLVQCGPHLYRRYKRSTSVSPKSIALTAGALT